MPSLANYIQDKEKNSWVYRRLFKPLFLILFFAVGFYWQSLTLNRIDSLWINIVLLLDIIILGVIIAWFNMIRSGRLKQALLVKYEDWYPYLIQFLLGGLFSSYLIFYFQSASFTKNALFLLLFIVFLIINQFFRQELTHIFVQISMFFIVVISYFIFSLPVVFGVMNKQLFNTAGIISLGIVLGLLTFLWLTKSLKSNKEYFISSIFVLFFFLVINILYNQNLIPPVPMSMKDGGIYHKVERIGDQFKLSGETQPWYQIGFLSYPVIHYKPGDTVFCYVSIFAPTKFKKKIFHKWEHYDAYHHKWVTYDKIGYDVIGGRGGGYRGYTFKTNIFPGQWRVDVITGENRILGRIPFRVIREKIPVTLNTTKLQ